MQWGTMDLISFKKMQGKRLTYVEEYEQEKRLDWLETPRLLEMGHTGTQETCDWKADEKRK